MPSIRGILTAAIIMFAVASAPALAEAADGGKTAKTSVVYSCCDEFCTKAKAGAGAKPTSILMDAQRGKGNFGLGATSYDDAMAAGKGWVTQGGQGYRMSTSARSPTMISDDGLYQFRAPSFKPDHGIVQANFERRMAPGGPWMHNGHLDIYFGPGGAP